MSDLVIYEQQGNFLAPAVSVDLILQAYQAKKEIVERVLRPDVDFGTIPGSSKNALYKPGAEKFCNFYGLSPVFEDIQTVEDWTGADHGGEAFFYYRQKCKLYKADRLMGEADGSCNSWEVKYRYRTQERTCPACGAEAIKKSKYPPRDNPQAAPGWYCFAKVGGCGANFPAGDESIESQQLGRIPNPDVSELVNTILKMAQKRALVAAVLIVTGASDYFTQDVEDFVDGTFTEAPTPEPKATPATKQNRKPAATKPTNGDSKSLPQKMVDAGYCENIPAAAELLNKYVPADIKTDHEEVLAWTKVYRDWRNAGSEPQAAAENATNGDQIS